MTGRTPRAVSVATAASALLIAFGASVAQADLFGGDVAVLSAIFETSLKQLDEARRVTESLGRSYRELQRLGSYATDTRTAFADFQKLQGDRTTGSGVRALQGSFPEAASGTTGWARASGSLQPEVDACVASLLRARGVGALATSECQALRRTASDQRLRTTLDQTYGSIPKNRPDLAGVRADSVASEQGRVLAAARMALVSDDASTMLARCKEARDPVVCERIAAEAGVKGYEQQAETNRKLEELVHQQAVANELRAAEQRRGLAEERARRAAILRSLTEGSR